MYFSLENLSSQEGDKIELYDITYILVFKSKYPHLKQLPSIFVGYWEHFCGGVVAVKNTVIVIVTWKKRIPIQMSLRLNVQIEEIQMVVIQKIAIVIAKKMIAEQSKPIYKTNLKLGNTQHSIYHHHSKPLIWGIFIILAYNCFVVSVTDISNSSCCW